MLLSIGVEVSRQYFELSLLHTLRVVHDQKIIMKSVKL